MHREDLCLIEHTRNDKRWKGIGRNTNAHLAFGKIFLRKFWIIDTIGPEQDPVDRIDIQWTFQT